MRVVPCESFMIELPRRLPDVVEALREQIQRPIGFVRRWPRRHKLFSGRADASGFTLKLIARGRGGFVPVIRGRFEEQGGATLVRVRIAMSALEICYLVALYCFAGLMVYRLSLRGELSWPWALVFGGLALFGLLVTWLSFRQDANVARRNLEATLGAAGSGRDTPVEEGN